MSRKPIELGKGAHVDIVRLLETRLLVQANSGGGKSWLLRKLLEESAAFVQWIVIDPEGEFRTLREQIDCVIAAPTDGDVVAHPATAALLARRLLETQLPAVVDIYELKAHERILFVRRFCEALVDAPKNLWHPVLVVLDEAHVFAPQVGDAESRGAVIDLATRGRKRGFALCAATQRLSKLHKDVAAELLNKLIGRTGLDVDVKRAADELGFDKDKGREMRSLKPGSFFSFGPAFYSERVEEIVVGKVRTTHPKAGHRLMTAPPKPSKKILAVLGKELADLPKQAAQQARTELELRTEVAALQARVKQLKASPLGKRFEQPKDVINPKLKEELIRLQKYAGDKIKGLEAQLRQADSIIKNYYRSMQGIVKIARAFDTTQMPSFITGDIKKLSKQQIEDLKNRVASAQLETVATAKTSRYLLPMPKVVRDYHVSKPSVTVPFLTPQKVVDDVKSLRSGAIKIIKELVSRSPAGYSRSQVATLVCMAPNGGTYLTYLSDLRRTGNIEERDGLVYASELAVKTFGGDVQAPTTHEEVMTMWGKALRKGAFNMLEHVVSCNAHGTTRDELAAFMNMAPKGGTYLTYLSDLRRNGLIEEKGGTIHAAPILFPEQL